MCDAPNNITEALENYEELEANLTRHEKSVKSAKAKLTEAKILIIAEYQKEEDKGFSLDLPSGNKLVASNPRKSLTLDNLKIADQLNLIEHGLSRTLATYKMADIRKVLSPKVIEDNSTASYSAVSLKVKKV